MTDETHVILVTGGAGFIGSHLAEALLRRDFDVLVLDNLSTGRIDNIRNSFRNPRFHFVKGDIRRHSVVRTLVNKVDAIFHLAAIASPEMSLRQPEIVNEVNVGGTINVLRSSLRADVAKIVYASSCSLYGEIGRVPAREDLPPNPKNPYAASKLAGEQYCLAFCRSYGLKTVSLRYFNVFGERQMVGPYSGVVSIFTDRLLRGLQPTIFGDGKQTRDFIHVSDVVNANVKALGSDKVSGQAINVGTGIPTTIRSLYGMLSRIIKRCEVSPLHESPRSGDIRHSCADVTKARKLMGFQMSMSLQGGLERFVNWYASENRQRLPL